ncbi:hypothetical protein C0Q70_21189 [Pomacea canaliculata]|uniref:Uncharacterized protein n=1 Tax=Pomacea canaliculata TaxID=400727 RepID=A0A2T7NBU5_POMCA|nr:putative uncharacterized protein CXorf58 [Pomacea canaliculata]PVD18639.1 hypothetical protein C0Q70_21189 [Pomacea canaliculata]
MDSTSSELKNASRTSIQVKLPSADQAVRHSPHGRSHHAGSPDAGRLFKEQSVSRRGHPQPVITIQQAAILTIENAWLSYRNKHMFHLLKHSVCAAESSLSGEILRKVCPREAELLCDKSFQIKVRFRFGGSEFPPIIFFKIFYHTDKGGQSVKYISGRKMIRPASEAAEDSLRLMGNRQFYDQMVMDTIQYSQTTVTDEHDVTTLKDYMQYLSNLDEMPATLGGRENNWRKLTLENLPRQTIFYDVVDYAYNHRMSPRLRDVIPILLTHPVTQEVQVEHIRTIGKISTPATIHEYTPKFKTPGLQGELSGRRTRRAQARALKMRRLYTSGQQSATGSEMPQEMNAKASNYFIQSNIDEDGEIEEEMDGEASSLYQWTQGLGLNDDFMSTPRPLPAH